MTGANIKEGKWSDAKYGKYTGKSCDFEIFIKDTQNKKGTVYFLDAGDNKALCVFLQTSVNQESDNQKCFDIIEATLNY